MISNYVYTSKKWIQKCTVVIVMTILLLVIVILHTDTSVMKQSMGNAVAKIKQLTGISEKNISSPFNPDFSTDSPFIDLNTGKGSVQFSVVSKIDTVIKRRFDERTALRNKVCSKEDYKGMVPRSLKGRISSLGKNRIKWCRIPKVGSTYLQGLERRVLRATAKNSGAVTKTKTMIMVREPYSRLVSGYIGKIVTNPPWQRSFGAAITKKFRPLATANARRCGHDVTFPEFLKYFIEAEKSGWMRNLHFVPIYKQCNPCSSKYDFIGHLETIKDDLSYALRTVNISIDMDFSDEESTTKGKARSIVKHRERILKCESMCSALSKVWWSFHARGLISTDIPFPLNEERCKSINATEFENLVWNAHTQSTGRVNKSKQRKDALITLYLQAPLEDRLKVQELMWKDFEIYGYDPQPDDLFPELKDSKL